MNTVLPSQEGREDVPSELSFVSAPLETDPMPVLDTSERDSSPGINLSHGH